MRTVVRNMEILRWLLLFINIISVNTIEQFLTTAFDNYHFECAKLSGVRDISINLVGSQGALRRDIVFSFGCERIHELFPWTNIPEDVARLEREDCHYSKLIDPLVDEDADPTCEDREYIAGITRLTTTRVRFLCCRLRTRDEAICTEQNFSKPTENKPKTLIVFEKMLINAISIKNDSYSVRFCQLQPRDIDSLIKDHRHNKRKKISTTLSTINDNIATLTPPLLTTMVARMTTAIAETASTTAPTTTTIASTMAITSVETTTVITTTTTLSFSPQTTRKTPTKEPLSMFDNIQESVNTLAAVPENLDEIQPITFPPIEFVAQQEDHDMVSKVKSTASTAQNTVADNQNNEKLRWKPRKSSRMHIASEKQPTKANLVAADMEFLNETKATRHEVNQKLPSRSGVDVEDQLNKTAEFKVFKATKKTKEIRRKEPSSVGRQRLNSMIQAMNDRKSLLESVAKVDARKPTTVNSNNSNSMIVTNAKVASARINAASVIRPRNTSYRTAKASSQAPSEQTTLVTDAESFYQSSTSVPVTAVKKIVTIHPWVPSSTLTKLAAMQATKSLPNVVPTTPKPKFMILTKGKKPELRMQQKRTSLKPSVTINVVNGGEFEEGKQRAKKVFKNNGKNYSQVVTSTLVSRNQNQQQFSTVLPAPDAANSPTPGSKLTTNPKLKTWLKDDPVQSLNSVMRSWQYTQTDLLSSLRRKYVPNFAATDKNNESNEDHQKTTFYGKLKDGSRLFTPESREAIFVTGDSIKSKNKKYFGKKRVRTDEDSWNLDIFDDPESYLIDVPPESFSPGAMRDELVSMTSSDPESSDSKDSLLIKIKNDSTEEVIDDTRNKNHAFGSSTATDAQYEISKRIPYDPAKFYHTPKQRRPPPREKILTFCTKEVAIRDMSNLVIACGDDFEIWRPNRCPEKSDCFFSKDSTYRICCPVAEAPPAFRANYSS